MNNQIIINSVKVLGFEATYQAIKDLVNIHQLITFKQANKLITDLNQLQESEE